VCDDGTCCECPDQDCVCCPDGVWCALTQDDCGRAKRKNILMKNAAKKTKFVKKFVDEDDCDGTVCDDGTCCECPGATCVCCPDGVWCAWNENQCGSADKRHAIIKKAKNMKSAVKKTKTLKKFNDDCPPNCPTTAAKFLKNAAKKSKIMKKFVDEDDCDGTVCDDGTCCECPDQDCVCCPDGVWCALTQDDCGRAKRKNILMKNAAKKTKFVKKFVDEDDCDGTVCDDGTCCECPGATCVCCPDGVWCAWNENQCGSADKRHAIIKKAKNMKSSVKKTIDEDDCNGTVCDDGTCCECPDQDCVCCPDGVWCALTQDDCGRTKKGDHIMKNAAKKNKWDNLMKMIVN